MKSKKKRVPKADPSEAITEGAMAPVAKQDAPVPEPVQTAMVAEDETVTNSSATAPLNNHVSSAVANNMLDTTNRLETINNEINATITQEADNGNVDNLDTSQYINPDADLQDIPADLLSSSAPAMMSNLTEIRIQSLDLRHTGGKDSVPQLEETIDLSHLGLDDITEYEQEFKKTWDAPKLGNDFENACDLMSSEIGVNNFQRNPNLNISNRTSTTLMSNNFSYGDTDSSLNYSCSLPNGSAGTVNESRNQMDDSSVFNINELLQFRDLSLQSNMLNNDTPVPISTSFASLNNISYSHVGGHSNAADKAISCTSANSTAADANPYNNFTASQYPCKVPSYPSTSEAVFVPQTPAFNQQQTTLFRNMQQQIKQIAETNRLATVIISLNETRYMHNIAIYFFLCFSKVFSIIFNPCV